MPETHPSEVEPPDGVETGAGTVHRGPREGCAICPVTCTCLHGIDRHGVGGCYAPVAAQVEGWQRTCPCKAPPSAILTATLEPLRTAATELATAHRALTRVRLNPDATDIDHVRAWDRTTLAAIAVENTLHPSQESA